MMLSRLKLLLLIILIGVNKGRHVTIEILQCNDKGQYKAQIIWIDSCSWATLAASRSAASAMLLLHVAVAVGSFGGR